MIEENERGAIKNSVLAIIEKYKPILFLQSWNFEILYPETEDQEGAMADCMARDEYMEATLRFYPCFFEAPNDVREHCIVHEMCHCLVSELQHAAEDLINGKLVTWSDKQRRVERLTQSISFIAMRERWPAREGEWPKKKEEAK